MTKERSGKNTKRSDTLRQRQARKNRREAVGEGEKKMKIKEQ